MKLKHCCVFVCFFTEHNAAEKDIFLPKIHNKLSPFTKSAPDLVKEHLSMLLPFLGIVTKLPESFELGSADAFKVVPNYLEKQDI